MGSRQSTNVLTRPTLYRQSAIINGCNSKEELREKSRVKGCEKVHETGERETYLGYKEAGFHCPTCACPLI